MKSMHEFFARLFSNEIENPKIKFTNTDSLKEKVYLSMYWQTYWRVDRMMSRQFYFQVERQIVHIQNTITEEI